MFSGDRRLDLILILVIIIVVCAAVVITGIFLIARQAQGRAHIEWKGAKVDGPVGLILAAIALGVMGYCFAQFAPQLEKENAELIAGKKRAEDGLKTEQDAHKKDKADADDALQKAKNDQTVAQAALEDEQHTTSSLRTRIGNLTKQLDDAREATQTALAAMDKSSLSDQQRREYDSRTQEVADINKNLSFIQIVPTHWPRIAGQKAVATFQIYSTGFQGDRDLERGAGLFDFDSEKYWPLKGDYQGKIYDGTNERLNSEIVDLICQAADRAVNQNVSIQDAIKSIRKPSGFDLSKELIPEFTEFSYAAMRIKAMAGQAVLLVRGYADGEQGAWEKPLDFRLPSVLQVHRNAGSDPMTAEINLAFQSTESPFEVGQKAGVTTVYTNKDLPNLRAASVAKVLTALMTACSERDSGPIPVQILDGWVYPHHDVADRKVRLFLVVFLKDS